jgi:exosome complex exonuclease RRP6
LLEFLAPRPNNDEASGNAPLQVIPFFDKEDVVERFDITCGDLLDLTYERIDTCFDVIHQEKYSKNKKAIVAAREGSKIVGDATKFSKTSRHGQLSANLRHAEFIRKPQLDFQDDIDNYAELFVPKLKEKPNAIIPLKDSLKLVKLSPAELHVQNLVSSSFKSSLIQEKYDHPYRHEIENLQAPSHMMEQRTEILPASIDSKNYVWVDTKEGLMDLAQKLEAQREFAVDLEAFDYRAYLGIVCLMQISTRDDDYLIDTFALRKHMHVLQAAFTNPQIVKVLHGADRDILWLQRDFGLYVVNLFDTYRAAKQLNLGKYSLAYLLEYYVGIQANKEYQLADWRIRPLPADFLKYAREDTHYLLYLYDRMRNALLNSSEKEAFAEVFQKSKETSLSAFEIVPYGGDAYRDSLRKFAHYSFNKIEVELFKAIHEWRDQKAKMHDESVHYVMSDPVMFKLATVKPKTVPELVQKIDRIPTLVRKNAKELVQLISSVIDQTVKNAEQLEVTETNVPLPAPTHTRFDSLEDGEMEIEKEDSFQSVGADLKEDAEFDADEIQEGVLVGNVKKEDVIIPSSKNQVATGGLPLKKSGLLRSNNKDVFETNNESLPFVRLITSWLFAPITEVENFVVEVKQEAVVPEPPKKDPEPVIEEKVDDKFKGKDMIELERGSDEEQLDDDIFVVSSKSSKSKRKIKHKSKAEGSKSQESQSQKKRKQEEPETSYTHEDMVELAKKRLKQLNEESNSKKKQSPQKDPYSGIVIDEKFNKKDARSNLKMKSGSRQATFTKSK